MLIDDPVQLLREWFEWWKADDRAPAKLPKSLQVRTGVFLAVLDHNPEVLDPQSPAPTAALLTPKDAARMLSLGRSRVYELIASGDLPSVKVGRSRRIRLVDLERYVADLEPETRA